MEQFSDEDGWSWDAEGTNKREEFSLMILLMDDKRASIFVMTPLLIIGLTISNNFNWKFVVVFLKTVMTK